MFALLGLVMPNERGLLERFFLDYNMSENNVVLITLAQVRQYNFKYNSVNNNILFKGLGIIDIKKKKIFKRGIIIYNY